MNDSPLTPGEPRSTHRPDDLEDNHFHDDDEVVPNDDGFPRPPTPVGRRKPFRRPPLRRSYPDDD